MRILGFDISRVPPAAAGIGHNGGPALGDAQPQANVSYRDIDQASPADGGMVGRLPGQLGAPENAMRAAAAYRSITLISGAVAVMPLHMKRRVDGRRLDASDHPVWNVITRRPNKWQTPSEFKRQLQSHILLRGNGYAMKVMNGTRLVGLLPLMPDRMEVKQHDDLSIEYRYTTKGGRLVVLQQSEVLHLRGHSLDGVIGLSPLRYAAETVGLALDMSGHARAIFANGARMSGTLSTGGTLEPEAYERLKASMEEFQAGGAREGKTLILEEGLVYGRMGLSMADAQFIEAAGVTRTEIFMFYGVPPHMAGDTSKSTSWGTGLEQQSQGFVAYTLEDWLTTWEEALARDCLTAGESDLYFRFNRNALVRGDIRARYAAYAVSRQWGLDTIDEIRALEDKDPLPDNLGANPFVGGNAQRTEGGGAGGGSETGRMADLESRLAALEERS